MNFETAKPLAASVVTNSDNKGFLIIGGTTTGAITLYVLTASGTTSGLPSIVTVPAYNAIFIPVRLAMWTGTNIAGVYELF